jgi:WD40 repeat protein
LSKLFKICLCALFGGLAACIGFRPETISTPGSFAIAEKTPISQVQSTNDKATVTADPAPTPTLTSEPPPTAVVTLLPVSATPGPFSALPAITIENAPSLLQLAEINFGPWDLVLAIGWSPDGETMAVAAGNSIYLYRARDLQQLWFYEIGALTQSLAFSPDDAWLAAGSRDGYVRIWSVDSIVTSDQSPPLFTLQAHRKGVNSVAFSPIASPLGAILASGGNDAVARFWNPGNGEELGYMVGGTFAVPSIAFLPDGSQLAVTNGDRIRLRQVGSERIVGTFASDEPLYSLAFSPDGSLLAVGGSDNLIRLWQPEQAFRTGQTEYVEPVVLRGHSGAIGTYRSLIWQVIFNSSGGILASAGGDASIRLWDIQSGNQLISLIAHPGGAACIAFRPDNAALASGGLDGVLRIWGVTP